jgi:hypothetical protein
MSRFQLRVASLLLFAFLIAPVIAGCTRRSASQNDDLQIETSLKLTPDPAQVGMALLEIQLKDESGQALTGVELSLRGDMTHAGMMPVMADAVEVRPGVYQAQLEWTMAGDWIVTLDGTLPDGTVFTRQLDVNVAP